MCVLKVCFDMVFSKSICFELVSCGVQGLRVVVVVPMLSGGVFHTRVYKSLTTPPTTMTATVAPRWGCTRGICHIGGRGCVGTPTVRENVTAEW